MPKRPQFKQRWAKLLESQPSLKPRVLSKRQRETLKKQPGSNKSNKRKIVSARGNARENVRKMLARRLLVESRSRERLLMKRTKDRLKKKSKHSKSKKGSANVLRKSDMRRKTERIKRKKMQLK